MAVETLPWHDAQWQRIARARGANRLPHAMLLAGPPGVGKSWFAKRLSDALVCATPDKAGDACGNCPACRSARAGTHPDQAWLRPEEAGKMIKIDAIRSLTAKSVLAAQQDGFRVYVIEPAEAMNRASANALLKTLEEPASRTVLILVSSQPDRLPATIRSRCQQVAFGVPDKAQATAWLRNKLPDGDSAALLAIASGAPLRALLAAEAGWLAADGDLIAELSALKLRKSNPLQIVEDWGKRPLTTLFDGFKRCVVDLLRLAAGPAGGAVYHPAADTDLQSLGQGIDLQALYLFNDELMRLDRDLANNLNPHMLLEHLANRWLQITRPGGR